MVCWRFRSCFSCFWPSWCIHRLPSWLPTSSWPSSSLSLLRFRIQQQGRRGWDVWMNSFGCSGHQFCNDGRSLRKHRWQLRRVQLVQERWSSRFHFLVGYRGSCWRLQQPVLGWICIGLVWRCNGRRSQACCHQHSWRTSSRIGTNLLGIRSYRNVQSSRRIVVRTSWGDFLWPSSMHPQELQWHWMNSRIHIVLGSWLG